MRVYSTEQVHNALDWRSLDSALTAAFSVSAELPLRHVHALNDADSLLLMPLWNDEAIGIKLVTVIPTAPLQGGRTVEAAYMLLDRRTGALQAIMDGEAITVRRTAMVSAIAGRYMARADSRELLMVGTGRLAPWMVRAHCAVRPEITRVRIWGRRADRADALVKELEQEGVPVERAIDLESAVVSADIVSCATTATEPVLRGEWLSTGVHVDLVGGFTPSMREADDQVVARSRIVVDTYDGVVAHAGDIADPIARGVIDASHVVAELGELIRGERAGRLEARDITMFKSAGTAVADLASALLVQRFHAATAQFTV